VSVTEGELRHIAALARLHLADERVAPLVSELNGILAHVEALQGADTSSKDALPDRERGMPLRDDRGSQRSLARPIESFAPAMRDGFFLVPRLATHEDTGEDA
jgi:aspartyl-tRNA(Asn)/glutamyl-tRNA(Gln) amidotransferase subunit C